MNWVQLDESLMAKLNGIRDHVAFRDETGKTVGYFVPDALFKKLVYHWMESQVTDEDLERISQEPGGRPLSEIWHRLEQQ